MSSLKDNGWHFKENLLDYKIVFHWNKHTCFLNNVRDPKLPCQCFVKSWDLVQKVTMYVNIKLKIFNFYVRPYDAILHSISAAYTH